MNTLLPEFFWSENWKDVSKEDTFLIKYPGASQDNTKLAEILEVYPYYKKLICMGMLALKNHGKEKNVEKCWKKEPVEGLSKVSFRKRKFLSYFVNLWIFCSFISQS